MKLYYSQLQPIRNFRRFCLVPSVPGLVEVNCVLEKITLNLGPNTAVLIFQEDLLWFEVLCLPFDSFLGLFLQYRPFFKQYSDLCDGYVFFSENVFLQIL